MYEVLLTSGRRFNYDGKVILFDELQEQTTLKDALHLNVEHVVYVKKLGETEAMLYADGKLT